MSNKTQTKFKIEHQKRDGDGRFVIDLEDGFEAQMTYVKTSPNTVSINHTGVPPEFRGQDIAAQLVDFGVHALADEGLKITPSCSYVAAQFKRHKDWSGFLA